MQIWLRPEDGILMRIQAAIERALVHPSRTVVLLPCAQLIQLATRLWGGCFPNGFMPKFETTSNWSRALRAPYTSPTDVSMDVAIDVRKAQPQAQPDLCAQLATHRAAVARAYPGQVVRAAFLTAQGALIELAP